MKILVTGSSGFLGSIFCLMSVKAGDEVLGTFLNSRLPLKGYEAKLLDIRNPNAAHDVCKTFNPDAIIHCARYVVGVGQCERDRETAFQINSIGTRNMVRCAEKLGACFVYVSTDWIFSGKKPLSEKYKESDDPCPLNYYGVTKWAGEQEVAKTKGRWLIVRPANIYGVHALFLESPAGQHGNALEKSSWIHKMVVKIQQQEKVVIPDTMIQSPVLANHLTQVSLRLMKEGKTGVYHVAGREGLSRYQFLRRVVEILDLNPALVVKGSLRELEESWGIPRELPGLLPVNACLDVEKVEKALGIKMLTVAEGISEIKDCLLSR